MSLKGVGSRSLLGPIISSDEMTPGLGFQMRGLEQMSGTRHSVPYKSINIRLHTM